jgi:hypothetical protein
MNFMLKVTAVKLERYRRSKGPHAECAAILFPSANGLGGLR